MSNESTVDRPLFWNAVGTVVDGAATAKEVLQQAGLDWTVSKHRIRVAPSGKVVPGRHAVVRDDTGDVFGIVSDGYRLIQNAEALDVLDSIVDSGDAKYECGWAERGGAKVGVTARIPEGVSVAGGDEHAFYLLLTMQHDGRGGLGLAVAGIRLRCTNMVNMAVRGARARFSIPHVGDPTRKIAQAREALGLTFNYIEAWKELADDLASVELTGAKLDRFLKDLTADRGERAGESDREGIRRLFESSPTLEGIPMNGYRLQQAVGEWYDWGRQVRTAEARLIGTTGTGLAVRQRERSLALLAN